MISHTRSHIVVWQKTDLINANFAVVLLRPESSFSLTLFSVFVLSLSGFGKIGNFPNWRGVGPTGFRTGFHVAR